MRVEEARAQKLPQKVAHLRNVHLPRRGGGEGEHNRNSEKFSPPGIVGERLPDDTCNIDEEKL